MGFIVAADLGINGGTTTSQTGAINCTGCDLLVVALQGDLISGGVDDITSMTYAGVAMTLAVKNSIDVATNRYTYLYFLLNPSSGSNNVVATSASVHYLTIIGAGYNLGLNPSGQPDATATNVAASATVASLTTAITTVANNCWVILYSDSYQGGGLATGGTNATLRETSASGAMAIFDSNGPVTPAGSFSMTTNHAGETLVAIKHTMASFKPTGGGGGVTYPHLERKTRGMVRGIFQPS